MRLLFVMALLCLSMCMVCAQDIPPYKIRGMVAEALGDKPVSNASVYIKNFDHIGTYSGSDGTFQLTIPGYAHNDVLIISSIGYESQEIALMELQDAGNMRVLLKPMTIALDEVTVRGRRIFDLERICVMALKKIPGNYPDKQHYIEGFYRKVSTDSTKFTGLVEAQIGIIDKGYKEDPKKLQVQLLNVRQGDNAIVWDSLHIKMAKKLKFDYNPSVLQSLHRLYESNLIRLYHDPATFFNREGDLLDGGIKKIGVRTQVELADITVVERDTILHIHYQWFSPSGERLDAVRMAVNLRNHAIVEFDRGIFGEQLHVKFKQQPDGRYYPVYIKRVTPVIFDKAKYKRYFNIEILETDRVETKGKGKLNLAGQENSAVDLDATRHTYDSLFWENYMRNNPHPMAPGILKSLEERTTLKQQFIQRNKK